MRSGAGLVMALALLVAGEARAHPHIWIEVESTLVAEAGAMTAVRHRWTFDALFSAFEVEGLDADGSGTLDPDELRGLAERYRQSLPPWSFFTEVRAEDGLERHLVVQDLDLAHANGRLVLDLDLAIEPPVPLDARARVRVHDRTFFVSLAYPSDRPGVHLRGAAGCTPLLHRPGQLDPRLEARLRAIPADRRELPADLAAELGDAAHRLGLDCAAAD